ncbi:MAG TPA: M28 family metallopeptidase [Terriglobales bacterium]|nr:M28 family metallopeptidase [Terriglobales bacterium]
MMIQSRLAFLGMLLAGASFSAAAQQHAIHPTHAPKSQVAAAADHTEDELQTAQPDPEIAAALKDVSADHIRHTIEKLVSFHTRLTISPATPQDIAAGHGIGAAREWIRSEFQRYSDACDGCLEVKTDSFTEQPMRRIPKPTEIVNVYAVLRGTNPANAGRIYLVVGHYDSRPSNDQDTGAAAPGANDDGSGTAVVLECARVLSKRKFPATIVFLTVAGEEQGLNGSRHFAKMARDQNWEINAVLSNDIVGGDKSPGQDTHIVRVFSEGIPANATMEEVKRIRAFGEESDSPSRELARYMREISRQYTLPALGAKMIFRPDRYLRGGDHSSFNDQGYAAVRLTEYRENFNHQHQTPRTENGIVYGDLPKYVDFDYVANVTRLNAATLASLASAPAQPADVRLDTKQLTNESTLFWNPSPGGLASSYEVLWRVTTAPEWENAEPVHGTRTTLDRSKDNVYFAVRAVDDKGHKSLPVIPQPER